MAAFSSHAGGGNPAGLVLSARPVSEATMRRVAAQVGYSETAFLVTRDSGQRSYDVRYFAPEREVSFCGHATIAAGVFLGEQFGTGIYTLHTSVGAVPVTVDLADGRYTATLTSVAPVVMKPKPLLVERVLSTCGWSGTDLHDGFVPAVAYAGAWHLVLVSADRTRLAQLEYDFHALRRVMDEHDLTTVAVMWPVDDDRFDSRGLFAPGGVIEDPATGAAAAAFGAYLRFYGHVSPPAKVTIVQGADMGMPSVINVNIPVGDGGIDVSGMAVPVAM